MAKGKKYYYFHLLRCIFSSSGLATLALLSFLLIPSHLFKGENGHWIELLDESRSEEAFDLLKIYSIVKSKRADLRDTWTWAISHTILEEGKRRSLDPMLILAVIDVESRFQNVAVSSEGARGLMQILPTVANALAEEADLETWEGEKSLDDPILNIKLGVFYLHNLKKNFRDLKLALTAYNWGPTEVKNRLEEDEMLPLEYAMKVLTTYQSYLKEPRQGSKVP